MIGWRLAPRHPRRRPAIPTDPSGVARWDTASRAAAIDEGAPVPYHARREEVVGNLVSGHGRRS